jgi:hypothetical protein
VNNPNKVGSDGTRRESKASFDVSTTRKVIDETEKVIIEKSERQNLHQGFRKFMLD